MSRREPRYRRGPVAQAMLAAKRPVLGADADCRGCAALRSEKSSATCHSPNTSGRTAISPIDDQIIGVVDPAIRAAADQRRVGKDDDARGPASAQAWRPPRCARAPAATNMRQPEAVDRPAGRQPPQARASHSGVNGDDQRIMAGACFARALREQPPRVAVRQPQLAEPLQRDQREDDDAEDHAASSSSPAQVKPGPKAVISTRSGRPRASSRSSTNSTVGALMLPIVAQHFALEIELALVEVERGLDRVDHLDAAGMAAEAVDVLRGRCPSARTSRRRRGASLSSMNGGMARSNTTPRPGSSTSPAHDAAACRATASRPSRVIRARPCSPAADDRRRGAVAEQRGRDDRRRIVAVEADRDRAGLDRHEQPVAAGIGAARRAASERPLTPPAQPRPNTGTRRTSSRRPSRGPTPRFQARRRDAGGGDGDDAVDLVGRQAGFFDRRASPPRRTALGRFQIDRVALGPAVRLFIPFGGATRWRRAIPALSNTPDSRSNSALLPPNARRPRSLASPCSTTCGGTAVASDSRLQGCMMRP